MGAKDTKRGLAPIARRVDVYADFADQRVAVDMSNILSRDLLLSSRLTPAHASVPPGCGSAEDARAHVRCSLATAGTDD